MNSATSGGNPGPAQASGAKSAPAVAFLDCPDHSDLTGVLNRLRQSMPSLLPSSLTRKVVIKPNLCDIVAWEAGVTTDPTWLGVLAGVLRSIRPDVEILVVESDAISAYKTYRSCDEAFERLGYAAAARREGIKLVNLTDADSVEIALSGIPYPIRIAQLLLEEFYFISIANLKIHPYERMTAILKNSVGLLCDADISFLHPHLSGLIRDLHLLCPPDLCIVDGRIGLEGHGPILGDPVPMDSIIFSNDALSADAAACKLMQIPPEEVPHLGVVAKSLHRRIPEIQLPEGIRTRQFAFDAGRGHRSILVKFASRRLHKSSESFANRWIDRFFRFKQHPLTFAIEGISKLVRRAYAR